MRRRGEHVWQVDENFAAEQAQAARAGELVGGFAGGKMTCTMRLQPMDRTYWPDAKRGEALYIHKLAVGRTAASAGWPGELIAFALDQARQQGIGELRLDTLSCEALVDLYSGLGFVMAGPAPGPSGLVLMRMAVTPGQTASPELL